MWGGGPPPGKEMSSPKANTPSVSSSTTLRVTRSPATQRVLPFPGARCLVRSLISIAFSFLLVGLPDRLECNGGHDHGLPQKPGVFGSRYPLRKLGNHEREFFGDGSDLLGGAATVLRRTRRRGVASEGRRTHTAGGAARAVLHARERSFQRAHNAGGALACGVRGAGARRVGAGPIRG